MTKHVNTSNFITIVRLQETTTDGQCYIAYHPELPSCISQGETPEEAEANLVEATEMAIKHLLAHGLPIPQPFSLQDATPKAPHTAGYESTEEVLSFPAARVMA
jgi:predicted RNase H-like HicB family nuclease